MIRTILNLVIFTSLFALAAGCGSPKTSENSSTKTTPGSANGDNSSLSGNITIEGSSTVEPISNRAKEKFNGSFPNVNISVSGQGTGNGFKALGAKECDVSDASRPIKQKELEVCKSTGINFYEIPVAYDGLTIVVNKKNDFVDELTVEQLKQIFREDTAAKTWKDVNDAWPDKQITIYAPGIASGTHDYFVEVIGKK
ncbi:MAG: phosphate-binding protein, partial [Planctomycetaceae bacterium]|nr:phosphate-binding protein [Planctomycetaceae bacterium]